MSGFNMPPGVSPNDIPGNGPDEDEFDKPACKLIGTDGNVFAIIGTVTKTLRQAGMPDRAKEFANKAMHECATYDQVLALCFDYVEVE